MRKYWGISVGLIALGLGFLFPVAAAAEEQASTILTVLSGGREDERGQTGNRQGEEETSEYRGFSVSAVLPENQRDMSKSYFDIKLDAGQSQELAVILQNPNDYALTVNVEAITASTNSNGIINYFSAPKYTDVTLLYGFADLAVVSENTVQVPAQGEKSVRVTVTMPPEKYDGLILGSIYAVDVTGSVSAEKEDGVALENGVAYATAVHIRMTGAAVSPSFGLQVESGRPAVIKVRNTAPEIMRGIQLHTKVYPMGDPVLLHEFSCEEVEMAPNSVLPITVGQEFEEGDYYVSAELIHNGQTYNFEEEFSIRTDAESYPGVLTIGLPNGAKLAILFGISAVIVGLIYFIGLLLRIRRENREYERQMYERTDSGQNLPAKQRSHRQREPEIEQFEIDIEGIRQAQRSAKRTKPPGRKQAAQDRRNIDREPVGYNLENVPLYEDEDVNDAEREQPSSRRVYDEERERASSRRANDAERERTSSRRVYDEERERASSRRVYDAEREQPSSRQAYDAERERPSSRRVNDAERERASSRRANDAERERPSNRRVYDAEREQPSGRQVYDAERERPSSRRANDAERERTSSRRVNDAERERASSRRVNDAERERASSRRVYNEEREQPSSRRAATSDPFGVSPPPPSPDRKRKRRDV